MLSNVVLRASLCESWCYYMEHSEMVSAVKPAAEMGKEKRAGQRKYED